MNFYLGKKYHCSGCGATASIEFEQGGDPVELSEVVEFEQMVLADLYGKPGDGNWFHECGCCGTCIKRDYFNAEFFSKEESVAALTFIVNEAKVVAGKILSGEPSLPANWRQSASCRRHIGNYKRYLRPHLKTLATWLKSNPAVEPLLFFESDEPGNAAFTIRTTRNEKPLPYFRPANHNSIHTGCGENWFEVTESTEGKGFFCRCEMDRTEAVGIVRDDGMGLLSDKINQLFHLRLL